VTRHVKEVALPVDLPGATLVRAHPVAAAYERHDLPLYAEIRGFSSRANHDLGQYSGLA